MTVSFQCSVDGKQQVNYTNMRRLFNRKASRQEMAWNEPGDSGKDRDPWGSRGGDQGPPDLDEVVRKLQEKFECAFFGTHTFTG